MKPAWHDPFTPEALRYPSPLPVLHEGDRSTYAIAPILPVPTILLNRGEPVTITIVSGRLILDNTRMVSQSTTLGFRIVANGINGTGSSVPARIART